MIYIITAVGKDIPVDYSLLTNLLIGFVHFYARSHVRDFSHSSVLFFFCACFVSHPDFIFAQSSLGLG